ncbi:MAG: diguanylate cyclase [Magnetococcales bacterium]|nr:diguanylate cyclase [Magnetococcales bacterium]
MKKEEILSLNSADTAKPIQLAPKIWWVGAYLPEDNFQCHSYLIVHGDQSILIDPGSVITIDTTLRKIEEIIPFSNIRYFLCQHQDPDITSSLPIIDRMVNRDDAVVLSHWRTNTLIKHYGFNMPMVCVENGEWKLDIGGRELQFIFTPYLHFPGAFCTFDKESGILFSSDLFGGISEEWSLIAKDKKYFEAIRPFHEHYMPHKDILVHSLCKLDELQIELIAPQHGSIIPKHLIAFMISQLKSLDCGLFLMTKTNSDFHRLSQLNKMLQDVMQIMTLHRDFKQVAEKFLTSTKPFIPAERIEFYSLMSDDRILHLAPETNFRAHFDELPKECKSFMGKSREHWDGDGLRPYIVIEQVDLNGQKNHGLILPLFCLEEKKVSTLVIFRMNQSVVIDDELANVLFQISGPLGVAIEREVLFQTMDQEREKIYQRSIRDPLTNLYTRIYMLDTADRLCRVHDRDPNANLAVVMFDIDHFKSVNDTFGHDRGDEVLKEVASVIIDGVRSVDIPVRMGGEEFVTFLVGAPQDSAIEIVERIRQKVSELRFEGAMKDRTITISSGVAFRHHEESLDNALKRADMSLYKAKNSGRNRVVISDG